MADGRIKNRLTLCLILMADLTTLSKYYLTDNQVLTKKALVEYTPRQDIKISSSLAMPDLKIVGSWDNWQSELTMELGYNNLKGCE